MLYSRGWRIVILAEIEPCGKWMMQAMSWLTSDAVNCAPPSHNSQTKLHVVWWSGGLGSVVLWSSVLVFGLGVKCVWRWTCTC